MDLGAVTLEVTTVRPMPPAPVRAGGILAVVALFFACTPSSESGAATPAPSDAVGWHLRALNADPARRNGRGAGMVIALLDTGFEASALRSFGGRVVNPWSALDSSAATPIDANGHGTAMAVISAGGGDLDVWGLAPEASVMPVLVADQYGHATPGALAAGIHWAVAHHASVINISMASMVSSAEVSREVAMAVSLGIPVVAAAGDVGDLGPEFPASQAGVIAAYGQEADGHPGPHSNQPDRNGVLVPGEGIDSLVMQGGDVRRQKINGSSAAAAVISGILAACMSAAPGLIQAAAKCVTLLVIRPPARFIDVGWMLKEVA